MQRFLVVDDHRLFLEGMQYVLSSIDANIVIDTADTVAAALRLLEQKEHYDLILVDLAMPELGGFHLIQSLSKRGLIVPVIVVSSSTNISEIRRCLELGASGYIYKNASGVEMTNAVKRVLSGEVVLPENLSNHLEVVLTPDKNSPGVLPAENTAIGERQLEVLGLIDEGLSNKQIARVLSISEATVKYHIGIIFRQLEVKNRTSCLLEARKRKLLE